MSLREIDTLIIDLDNTIFDWFSVWYASFKPIYDEIVSRSGETNESVEKAIREVHQKRRTSEYTFLIEEVSSLRELREKCDIRDVLSDTIDLSHRSRDKALRLYPTVLETLWAAKNAGVKIVAYTESMSFYSAYRLKRFGLDGVIDILFSPEDHAVPAGVPLERLRRLPDEFYELQVTKIRHTPRGELKPNSKVLKDILASIHADRTRCAYVGDSLFKDVAMARDVGVLDIHAKYGEAQHLPEYDLLKRVSHWTEDDVQREQDILSNRHEVQPSIVLEERFSEILLHCVFTEFSEKHRYEAVDPRVANALEVWKKCVDVQQHFNDLSMRVRNFAITAVGAFLAAVGFTYQQGLQVELFGKVFSSGLGIIIAAAFAWFAFFLMDRYWYHVFLRGAVAHAAKIEAEFSDAIPGIGLGSTISDVSQKAKIFGIWKMNSERRLNSFYGLGFIMLAIVFFALWLGQPTVDRGADFASGDHMKTEAVETKDNASE